jgi:hypothetical protein
MGIPWKPKAKPIRYPNIVECSAARAIYQGPGQIPRVDLKFVTSDGLVIEFDLDHLALAHMIEHTMQAYNSIFPALKTSRGGRGI